MRIYKYVRYGTRRAAAAAGRAQRGGQDGLSFDAASLRGEPIREGAEYGGVQLLAYLGTMRIPVRAVTPGPAELSYPVLLELPAPRVQAYPLETVVAEKPEAVVRLGLANSRLKDFYDLWAIARGHRLEAATLGRAIAGLLKPHHPGGAGARGPGPS